MPVEPTLPDSSIVRIFNATGEIVGTGFLVAEKRVLTCAHVVNTALMKSEHAEEFPSEGIQLDFPFANSTDVFIGVVRCWNPARRDDDGIGLDVALIEVSGDIPTKAQPAPLQKIANFWGRSFRCNGFPKRYGGGQWVSGTVQGALEGGRVQLQGDGSGPLISAGFSGGLVWDGELEAVIGMIVQSDGDSATRLGSMIPTTVLVQACSQLLASKAVPRQQLTELEHLLISSRSRCMVKWRVLGVTAEEAKDLVDIAEIGALRSDLPPNSSNPVRLLLADIGAGKTLAGERLHQQSILKAQQDESVLWPIRLEGRPPPGRLYETIISHLQSSSLHLNGHREFLHGRGVDVVIDDAPSESSATVLQTLDDARHLVGIFPGSTVVILSRPASNLLKEGETTYLPNLTWDESQALIGRFIDIPHFDYRLSQHSTASVANAIVKPLFAILLAVYLREHNSRFPSSTGQLLHDLTQKAFDRAEIQKSAAALLLQKLAVAILKRSSAILSTELFSKEELGQLLDTGLIVEEGRTVRFLLDVLTEWFGYESLVAGMVSPDERLSDSLLLVRWLPSLSIFISESDHSKVSPFLFAIARKNPAFASILVFKNLRFDWQEDQGVVNPPPWVDCAQRLQQSMMAWSDGLGPLASLVCPIGSDGKMQPIGGCVGGPYLAYGWYRGEENLEDIIQFPSEIATDFMNARVPRKKPMDWPIISRTGVGAQSAWAWRLTHEKIQSELSNLLHKRAFPLEDGAFSQEVAWQTALKLANKGSLYHRPLKLNEIESRLEESADLHAKYGGTETAHLRHGTLYDPLCLRREVMRLRGLGETVIVSPWPGPDEYSDNGWIIDPITGEKTKPPSYMSVGSRFEDDWSDERILQRVQMVFTGALNEYEKMVSRWFPTLREWMATSALFPVCMFVSVHSPRNSPSRTAGTSWFMEPLPAGHKNFVDAALARDWRDPHVAMDATRRKIHELRPNASWVGTSFHNEGAFLFDDTPALDIVYKWLENDLKRIGLLDNSRSLIW